MGVLLVLINTKEVAGDKCWPAIFALFLVPDRELLLSYEECGALPASCSGIYHRSAAILLNVGNLLSRAQVSSCEPNLACSQLPLREPD